MGLHLLGYSHDHKEDLRRQGDKQRIYDVTDINLSRVLTVFRWNTLVMS